MSRELDTVTAQDAFADPHEFYRQSPTDQNKANPRSERSGLPVLSHGTSATPKLVAADYTHSHPQTQTLYAPRSDFAYLSAADPAASPPTLPGYERSPPSSLPRSRSQQGAIKDLVNRFNQSPPHALPVAPFSSRDRYRRAADHRPKKLTKSRSPTKHTTGSAANMQLGSPEQAAIRSIDGSPARAAHGRDNARGSPARTSSTPKRRLQKPCSEEDRNGDNHTAGPRHGKRGLQQPTADLSESSNGKHRTRYAQEVEPVSQHLQARTNTFEHETRIRSASRRPSGADLSSSSLPRPVPNKSLSMNYFPSSGERTTRGPTKENLPPRAQQSPLAMLTNRRNDPASSMSAQVGPSLRGFISSPQDQRSPSLKSSRPRQTVFVASTAELPNRVPERLDEVASYRTGDGFQRRRRNFPELGGVDLAERRARIERAITQSQLQEDAPDIRQVSGGSGPDSAGSRRAGPLEEGSTEDEPTTSGNTVSIAEQGEETASSAEHFTTNEAVANGRPLALQSAKALHDSTSADNDRLRIQMSPVLVEQQPDSPKSEDRSSTQAAQPAKSPAVASQTHASDGSQRHHAKQNSIFSQVLRMRERSTSSASRTDFEEDSALGTDDKGSIVVLLDGAQPHLKHDAVWATPSSLSADASLGRNINGNVEASVESLEDNVVNGFVSAPETPRGMTFSQSSLPSDQDQTPRQHKKAPNPTILTTISSDAWRRDNETYSAINRIIDQYRQSGDMSPDMLQEIQSHLVNMSPDLSREGDSDAATIKILLDTLLVDHTAFPGRPIDSPGAQLSHGHHHPYDLGGPSSKEGATGSALIHDNSNASENSQAQLLEPDTVLDADVVAAHHPPMPESEDLDALPRLGQPDVLAGAESTDDEVRPQPPPKDFGYSANPSHGFVALAARSPSPPSARLRTVSDYQFHLPDFELAGDGVARGLGLSIQVDPPNDKSSQTSADAPPARATSQSSIPDSAHSARIPSERHDTLSTGTRLSMDSQYSDMPSLPHSRSMPSFSQTSGRTPSLDRARSGQTDDPTPDQRRLMKRKNIMKELIDTEYSYHQDMKIIEDIYKATVGDLITADDKKTLFGNADQVEAFSLEFYDALRRGVAAIYVPAKSSKWHTKRGSFSTSASSSAEKASSADIPEEDMDRQTFVGKVFNQHIVHMEKVYGAYLKNHEAANHRLSKLQSNSTVKCWLVECHNNASDITSAWDLDSLLVKPTQRILKYPLLLQQLLESTPADHPDHATLAKAVKHTMSVSQRINEAKKRADLVEQIVSRKKQDSDLRTGLAKAFGRRSEKLKERVGVAEAYQDPDFDEIAHKFGGHFIRLQVCMRDVQGSLAEMDKSVGRISAFAAALEAYVEVGANSFPEIESRWRKFSLAVRELAAVALPDHKNETKKRVINPMIQAIKLHDGPQNAIVKRKKLLLDYATCKSTEKRGQKPDKKTVEAAELYGALNEQLKIDLPRLYSLTADLIQACLACHSELQMTWHWTWEMKLRPVLDAMPPSIASIEPAFHADYDFYSSQLLSLGLCNGSMLAEATNFLSPQSTLVGEDNFSVRRPSGLTNSSRTVSVGSEYSPRLADTTKSNSGSLTLSPINTSVSVFANGQGRNDGRMRSSSSLSSKSRVASSGSVGGVSARLPSQTTRSPYVTAKSHTTSAHRPADLMHTMSTPARMSMDGAGSTRPNSGSSYFTAQQDATNVRFSGLFSSAMPLSDSSSSTGQASPRPAIDGMHVMFVAASLFEFSIDRTRKEAGYPYLTYVQGEVFDVVGQKGELWLAKNQDDRTNSLGWIWEQHFVILSQDS